MAQVCRRSHGLILVQRTATRRHLVIVQIALRCELLQLVLRRHQLLGTDLHWHDHCRCVHLALRGVPVQGRRWH